MVYGYRLVYIIIFAVLHCETIYHRNFSDIKFSPPQEPNYSLSTSWASLPEIKDDADYIIPGSKFKDEQKNARADVFFIHPTTYLKGKNWNGDIHDNRLNNRTDKRSIKIHGSIFNGCCKVYAPRYRQAMIHAFYKPDLPGSEKSLHLAYIDVKKSFEYFLKNYNKNRPIIIAGHSQGSYHAKRILVEYKDSQWLKKRLVVAYLVGMPAVEKNLPIPACKDKSETGCFVSWSSYGKNGDVDSFIKERYRDSVCINPLIWKQNDNYANPKKNIGGVNQTVKEIIPEMVGAACNGPFLEVDEPLEKNLVILPGKNYHVIDYHLFYSNVRMNAIERVQNFNNK